MPSILLLPERRRLAGQDISPEVAARLGRADRLRTGQPGERAQLERHFTVQPHGWPMAAIQRRFDAGDAGDFVWLRADPVHVRADMTGVRLMAWGNLELDDEQARQFLTALRPIFEDAGLDVSATAPDRWFLRMPPATTFPVFSDPMQALGADLFEHLPPGETGRRWRSLLSDAQVILHNHPANAERTARGQPPVNSVWFWGGGSLPEAVETSISSVESEDPELLALFAASATAKHGPNMLDLRHVRDWRLIEERMAAREPVILDFVDGMRWRLQAGQGWRFWRRPLQRLEA
jgi:hypothetical protein